MDSEEETKACIYRVAEPLRAVNPAVFSPQVVSIGPYHAQLRRDPRLEQIEELKQAAVAAVSKDMAEGRTFDHLINEIARDVDSTILPFYDRGLETKQDKGWNRQELAKLFAVDAAFVVSFLHAFTTEHIGTRKYKTQRGLLYPSVDSNFLYTYKYLLPRPLRRSILQDILLLENQIPLFLLLKVIQCNHRIQSEDEHGKLLDSLLFSLASRMLPVVRSQEVLVQNMKGLRSTGKHLLDCIYTMVTISKKKDHQPIEMDDNLNLVVVPSVTSLHNSGVKFKGHDRSLADVSFEGGVLTLPIVHVNDDAEGIFRNLLAYESYMPNKVVVLSYLHFMNDIIDTEKDVNILVANNILKEKIGSDEEAAKLWNKLCKNTTCAYSKTHYAAGQEASRYVEKRVHSLVTEFRRAYFSKPWVVISVFYAFAIFIISIITMLYTIFLYLKEE